MQFIWFDILFFVITTVIIIVFAIYLSRKEESGEDYFLAGRSLNWPLIGFSLIATNISTEHFVGMSGASFGNMGLAVASYEWIAAITLVFVALFLLPHFLKAGVYTIPEFLEYRYSPNTRLLMSIYMTIMYVCVAIASVLYSGGIAMKTIFGFDLTACVWAICILSGIYTIFGGLKAVVWADLLQGAGLLLGGLVVMIIGFVAVGGPANFFAQNTEKLHMVMPIDHPEIPWTALLLGIWIPNLFYWGLNQFIVQRTLAAKSVIEGQKGILLAAFIKITIPFIIVMPGIMAYQLFKDQNLPMDQAYPTLVRTLLPAGCRGIMLAALFGAVMSTLAALLNSASSIFTMDLYKRHLRKNASPKEIVTVGRITTTIFMLLGCIIAPFLASPKFGGIFKYIQMFQGFISPGIVTVFVFGLIVKKAPPSAAITAMLLNIIVYGVLRLLIPQAAFLNHMAITFIVLIIVMAIITAIKPLKEPYVLPVRTDINLESNNSIKIVGGIVIAICVILYIIFW